MPGAVQGTEKYISKRDRQNHNPCGGLHIILGKIDKNISKIISASDKHYKGN